MKTTRLTKYLREYRAKRAWTQAEMAQHLGIAYGYYKLIETGRRTPGVMLRKSMAKVMRRSESFVYDLIYDEED